MTLDSTSPYLLVLSQLNARSGAEVREGDICLFPDLAEYVTDARETATDRASC
ncbi:hypothetical protein I552_8868 [Mycobacterium xenopi 3993]|nr:hypothetical protein I552_8868 [Mycobacterium xenopi 3993]